MDSQLSSNGFGHVFVIWLGGGTGNPWEHGACKVIFHYGLPVGSGLIFLFWGNPQEHGVRKVMFNYGLSAGFKRLFIF